MFRKPRRIIAGAALAAAIGWANPAALAGSSFTYQGQLTAGGSSANGTYAMTFRLFDEAVGGNQPTTPITYPNVNVVDGLFSVELDYGGDAFQGADRWLEIVVNDVTLNPRVAVTNAPYSNFSQNTRGITVDAFGMVGIDNATPAEKLVVGNYSGGDAYAEIETAGSNQFRSGLKLRHFNSNYGWTIESDERHSSYGLNFLKHFADAAGVSSMFLDVWGRVGVGTVNPGAKLDVRGAGGVSIFAGDRAPFGTAAFETDFTNPQTHAWFAENGSRVFSVAPGGEGYFASRLGIGTGTPTARLHVDATGAGVAIFAGNSPPVSQALFQTHTSVPATHALFVENGQAVAGVYPGGTAVFSNLAINVPTNSATLHVGGTVRVDGSNTLEFGGGVTKESNSGKIGYGTFTAGTLDIVGAGTTTSNRQIKLHAEGGTSLTGPISILSGGSERAFGGVVNGRGTFQTADSQNRVSNYIGPNASTDNPLMCILDSSGEVVAGFTLTGDTHAGAVFAEVKAFSVANPADPETNIWYASLEGPEAAMYVRGKGRLENGQAVIELPEHFQSMMVADSLTVQLTAASIQSRGLAYEIRDGQIVVGELNGGQGSYEFSWEVTSVRRGYENYQVVRPWDAVLPANADRDALWQARQAKYAR